MKKQPHGNGSGRFEIGQADMGGWVRVFPARADEPRDDLAVYLAQTLTEWFRQRPPLRLRCVVPVSRGGDTAELHAWYDTHVFPPTPEGPQPTGHGPG
jgi:hypothetical protein